MKRYGKIVIVTCALFLASAFVAWRAGAFDGWLRAEDSTFIMPGSKSTRTFTAVPSKVLPGSKREEIVRPADLTNGGLPPQP